MTLINGKAYLSYARMSEYGKKRNNINCSNKFNQNNPNNEQGVYNKLNLHIRVSPRRT